jgi:hypothetical protein
MIIVVKIKIIIIKGEIQKIHKIIFLITIKFKIKIKIKFM